MLPDEELAVDLRGFGPAGIVAMIVILLTSNVTIGPVMLPVGGFLVLAWTKPSRTPWHEIGYVRPRSWIGSLVAGPYHYLAGNRAVLPAAIFTMLAAGFGEETVFRGYLFERLGKLFGSSAGARVAIVALTGRLWMLMWAHAAFDLAALAVIYWNLEARVAHLVFN